MPRRFLAAAAVVLVGLAVLVTRRADLQSSVQPLKAHPVELLFRVEVSRQGEPGLALEKKAGLWKLTAPVDDLADAGAADDLLASLYGLNVGTQVSSRSENWPGYGLAEAAVVHVKVFARDQAVPALDGYFGLPAMHGTGLYYRAAREKPVYIADGLDPRPIMAAADAYRERAFFPDTLGAIASIRLRARSKVLELKKGEPAWETASKLRVADFASWEDSGLDRPVLLVEASGSARSAHWRIGKPIAVKGGKALFRYAACDERPGVLATVAVYDADALLKAFKK